VRCKRYVAVPGKTAIEPAIVIAEIEIEVLGLDADMLTIPASMPTPTVQPALVVLPAGKPGRVAMPADDPNRT
jgi:hypothetical protein